MRSELTIPCLAAALVCGAAGAQTQPLTTSNTMVEAGAGRQNLTAGLGQWTDVFVRANLRAGNGDLWQAELVNAKHFGERGTLLAIGNTHNFNADWYTNVAVAGSSGGFFFPNLRMDVTANRKWLAARNLITSLGVTAINAKDGHQDRTLLLGAVYYLPSSWVVDGGIRVNRSNPGSVASTNKNLALSYVRDKDRIVSLRHSFGNEAYQYIEAHALLVNFDSRSTLLTWREWLAPGRGIQLRAEAYHNPYYNRRGVELAGFMEF